MTQTTLQSRQEILSKKTTKAEGLKQIKQNWENIPLHGKTKETPISDYVVQV